MRRLIPSVSHIPESLAYADGFFLTAAAQRNRNHVGDLVEFCGVPFAVEELLFDPQTSGGLLVSMPKEDAEQALEEIAALGLPCGIVGKVVKKETQKIVVL